MSPVVKDFVLLPELPNFNKTGLEHKKKNKGQLTLGWDSGSTH